MLFIRGFGSIDSLCLSSKQFPHFKKMQCPHYIEMPNTSWGRGVGKILQYLLTVKFVSEMIRAKVKDHKVVIHILKIGTPRPSLGRRENARYLQSGGRGGWGG